MAQAGRLTFSQLEIPQAASATFAKDGGFTSPGSNGADRVIQYARDGGIESEYATTEFWRDFFGRSVSGGLGSADYGGAYILSGNTADFNVSGGVGSVNGNDNYYAFVPVSAKWGEVRGKVSLSALPAGANLAFDILFRAIDTANWYRGSIRFISTGRVDLVVDKFIAGASTAIAGPVTAIATSGYTAGAWLRWKARIRGLSSGPRIEIVVWIDGNTEPDYNASGALVGTDTGNSLPNAGKLGFRANTAALTNTPVVSFDEITTQVGNTATGALVTAIVKSGGFTSSGSLGGTRSQSYAKSGGGPETNAGAVGPGTQGRTYSKSSGIISVGSFGGSQQSPKVAGLIAVGRFGATKGAQIGKLGGISTGGKFGTGQKGIMLWSQFVLPQAASSTYSKTGGIISPGQVGIFRNLINIFARTGGTQSQISVGANKLFNLFDDWSVVRTFSIVGQPAKTGGIVGPVSVGPADNTVDFVRDGGIRAVGVFGGTKVRFVAKSGGISSAGSIGGTKGVQTVTGKLGGFTAGGVLGASRAYSVARGGGTLSVGVLGASKAYTSDKSGGIIGRVILLGDANATSAFSKVGGFQIGWSAAASKNVTAQKNGGFQGTIRFGALEIYKSGGIQTATSLGGSRSTGVVKSGGIISPWSSGASKNVTFTKTPAGITSIVVFGADQGRSHVRDGGFTSEGELGGSKFVPLRSYPVGGGTISAGSVGGDFTKFVVRTGGYRSTARLGEHPNIGIRSVGTLGGVVTVMMFIPPGGENQIVSVVISESYLVSAEAIPEAILTGGKL